MGIEQILPYLSPQAQAFIAQAMQQGDPQIGDMIVQIVMGAASPEEGIAQVEQAVAEFMQQMGMQTPGMAQPMAGGPPPGAPVDMPSPPSDPNAPLPPDPMMGGGGMVDPMTGMPVDATSGGAPPQQAPPPEPPPQRPVVKKTKKPPKYAAPRVPKVEKPTYDQILEDARAGREYWAQRDARIKQDIDLYHLTYDYDVFPGVDTTVVNGTIVHRRSQPNTFVNLVTSLCTYKNDKLQTMMEPRAEDEEYKTSTQNAEDAILCWREDDEERWLEERVAEPPLPRKEAGLAALEGGFGWSWTIDADNDECPFQYEIIPLSQLYDIGHATTRQFSLPLHQARARYEKIREYYPLNDKGRGWNPNQKLRIIIHADNHGVYRSMVWEEMTGVKTASLAKDVTGGNSISGGLGGDDSGEKWIQKPEKVNFGFRYFSYMTWGGSPAEGLNNDEGNTLQQYKGHGVLTMLRKTFRLMDLFVSAIATGAIKAVDPPYAVMSDNPLQGELDLKPHGFNQLPRDADVKPLVFEVSANSDSQNLMNSLIAELQDVSSPALMGAPGISGVAQQQSTEQASQQVVGPIIDALEKWYGIQHKQRLILALRYSKDTKYNRTEDDEDNTLFDKYPKRGMREGSRGEYGYLKPADIEKSGVRVKVRYTDRNIQEEMAIANMVQGLTQAHLMSQETAMRRLGVQNPQAEMQRIFADGAFMEPAVLKALVETAVYNSNNQTLINAWDKAFYAEVVAGQQGSEAAPTGTPSIPNTAGVNSTGTSSAVQAPMAQQMGEGQVGTY